MAVNLLVYHPSLFISFPSLSFSLQWAREEILFTASSSSFLNMDGNCCGCLEELVFFLSCCLFEFSGSSLDG